MTRTRCAGLKERILKHNPSPAGFSAPRALFLCSTVTVGPPWSQAFCSSAHGNSLQDRLQQSADSVPIGVAGVFRGFRITVHNGQLLKQVTFSRVQLCSNDLSEPAQPVLVALCAMARAGWGIYQGQPLMEILAYVSMSTWCVAAWRLKDEGIPSVMAITMVFFTVYMGYRGIEELRGQPYFFPSLLQEVRAYLRLVIYAGGVICAAYLSLRSWRDYLQEIMPEPEVGTIHHLKAWPTAFADMASGKKTFDYRKNDRNFAVGDIVIQNEFDPATDDYTGPTFAARITYILPGGQYGIPEEYCILGIEKKIPRSLRKVLNGYMAEEGIWEKAQSTA